MIQQRAEAGDAQAQTLMGMMAFYGYQLPRDFSVAKQWYSKAAQQGDAFAQSRLDSGDRITIRSTNAISYVKSSIELLMLSKEEMEGKIAAATSANYLGSVAMDALVLNRDQYLGTVVRVQFQAPHTVGTRVGNNPYVIIYGKNNSGAEDQLFLCGDDSLKWGMEQCARGYGVSCEVYALVERKGLIALGKRQNKLDDGYTYSW
jgi:TPR repeat protein